MSEASVRIFVRIDPGALAKALFAAGKVLPVEGPDGAFTVYDAAGGNYGPLGGDPPTLVELASGAPHAGPG